MTQKKFQLYSIYYDFIYRDKAYKKETAFVLKQLKKNSKNKIKNVLSLGCGTGIYERLISQKGYEVTGVDLSGFMLKIAKRKTPKSGEIRYVLGDARTFRASQKFDCVIAMFNIAGYQNSDRDFLKFCKTASSHLSAGGVFCFDAWNKSSVLSDPPQNREKIISLSKLHKITRQTLQRPDFKKSLLKIKFIITETKNGKVINKFSENHPMKFFSLSEIKHAFKLAGLKMVSGSAFPFNAPISKKHWDMFIVGKKI